MLNSINRRESVSSWLVSITLHAGFLFLIAMNLKSCTSGSEGSGNSDFREVGIYLKQEDQSSEQTNAATPSDSEDKPPVENKLGATPNVSSPTSPETPPVPLKLPPLEAPNSIGIGRAVPQTNSGSSKPNVSNSGAPREQVNGANSGKPGETSFMGLNDSGKSFVYLVDSSGSMINHNAIRVAKAELMQSLASLKSTQKFQIIFYNNSQQVMSIRGGGKKKMYFATDINRTLARQFISGIQADQGTERMGAIQLALSYQPEVLFFLTDADQPILTARDLNKIKQMNKSKTRFHCIEFGRGGELAIDNFLKKLARGNKGTYGYRDITRFDKR